jgi:alkylhydroperoxidase/carboxymuconolactone decarboxylase family protein YurZ
MGTDTVRIPPLPVENFTTEQAALVGDWKHLVFSRVLINSPRMYRGFVTHLADLVTRTILPPRDRQLICMRMLELCGDVYELTHHLTISRNAGLTEDEITAFREGAGACLTEFDRTLLTVTAQLQRDQYVNDATWAALAVDYSQEQLMEVVFLAGCYLTMAMLTKSFGIQLESAPGEFEHINTLRSYT